MDSGSKGSRSHNWTRRAFALRGGAALCAVFVAFQPLESEADEAYIAVEMHSKKILFEKNGDKKLQVASLTKIATAMVVLDWAELTGTELSTMIRVPTTVSAIAGANPLRMRPGDEISMRDALYSAVMGSDNAAALTLGTYVGYEIMQQQRKSGNPLDYFIAQMNALARSKGCERTKFTNPHGLDHQRPVPYSTAEDIARITVYALSKPGFTFYCSQPERKISFRRAGEELWFLVKNTNQLLGTADIDGVKTGLTSRAGQCLVTTAERPNTVIDLPDGKKRVIPQRIVVVVLGSSNRFDQSLRLLQSAWQHYDGWNAQGRRIQKSDELLSMGP